MRYSTRRMRSTYPPSIVLAFSSLLLMSSCGTPPSESADAALDAPIDVRPDALPDAVQDAVLDAELPLPSLECGDGWVIHALGEPTMWAESARRSPILQAEEVRLATQTGAFISGQENAGRVGRAAWWVVHLNPAGRSAGEAGWASRDIRVGEVLGHGFYTVFVPAALSPADGVEDLVTSARPLRDGEKLGRLIHRLDPDERVDLEVVRWDGSEVVVEGMSQVLAGVARAVAARPDVYSVRVAAQAISQLANTRVALGVEEVQGFGLTDEVATYEGVTGAGVRIAIVDTGTEAEHPDFGRYDEAGERTGTRVSGESPMDDENHGTHVAAIAAGSGHLSAGYRIAGVEGSPFQWRGVAPGVDEIYSVRTGSSASREVWLQAFIDGNAYVSNHSYTQSNGFYLWRVANFDEAIRNGVQEGEVRRPPRPVVFSAGNYGLGAPPIPGVEFRGFHSVLSTGKNQISVGGTYANDDEYASSSSCGPTLDGRIKPDVVAPGFVDWRPLEGVGIEIRSVRLHAVEGSEQADRVLDFSAGLPETEWSIHGRLGELGSVEDGVLRAQLRGGDAELRYRPDVPFAADDYDRISIEMRLTLDTRDGRESWPGHWNIGWSDEPEDRTRGGKNAGFPEETRDGEWHTRTTSLGGRRYRDTIHFVRVRPIDYPWRGIISARLEERYQQSQGTSMSAPAVTGVIALLLETARDELGYDLEVSPPLPSTFKGTLVHTARDLVRMSPPYRDDANPDTGESLPYGPGPDFVTGWGLVRADRAIALLRHQASSADALQEREIAEGEVQSWRIPVDASSFDGSLRVTVVWDDAPGPVMSDDFESKLVNDLDVVLLSPSGVPHGPWVIDPLPIDSESYFDGIDPIETSDLRSARRCEPRDWWAGALGTEPRSGGEESCEDHRNNVEQVLVDAPESGWWTVVVRGGTVPEGPQRYSLFVTQDCS